MRKYWPNFIQDTEVLLYVIDSADRKRFPEAYDEMHKLLGEPRLEHKPFLVIANKQVSLKARDIYNKASNASITFLLCIVMDLSFCTL